MDALTCRLLPYADADGPYNMAADEVLLSTAAEGIASLRFYGWSQATLSLGYFQSANLREADPRLALLPWVRRPSGGGTLVHHFEVTYALALPPAALDEPGGQPWMRRMHEVLAAGLAELGVTVRAHVPQPGEQCPGCLCFQHFAAGDLILGESKVVGSAQRKLRGAILQHGAVLLAQSPHTLALPGILELTGQRLAAAEVSAAALAQFRRRTGWAFEDHRWTEDEHRRTGELVRSKYGTDEWNRRR